MTRVWVLQYSVPHSSTPAWKIPWTEQPGRLQSMGLLRVGHDWATSLSRIGEGNGSPPQCSCLENPRDGGAWWAAVYGVAPSRAQLKRLSSSSCSMTSVCSPLATLYPSLGLVITLVMQAYWQRQGHASGLMLAAVPPSFMYNCLPCLTWL